jgi:hypothetical protein
LEETRAEGPLTVDKASDGSFVYVEAARGGSGAAKHLDAVGKVLPHILLCN